VKLVAFDAFRVGAVEGDQVIDLSSLVPVPYGGTPYAMNAFIERIAEVGESTIRSAAGKGEGLPLSSVHLLPPVPRPGQLLAAPLNYRRHINEMASSKHVPSGLDREKTARELGFFVKASASIVGPADVIELPNLPGREFHHECELGVVIGRTARAVTREAALGHVFGYTCLIDVTMRMAPGFEEERAMRKSYHSFTPIGPHIVTADEIPDPTDLAIRLWVNDELRQQSSTANLIVDVAELIHLASAVTTLHAGDVYATGTPEGVGPIVPGDEVRIEIEGIGAMRIPVRTRRW